MVGMCKYDDWEEEYRSLAALLMNGFTEGFLNADIEIDILTCTELLPLRLPP